jgi:hypothetical protein
VEIECRLGGGVDELARHGIEDPVTAFGWALERGGPGAPYNGHVQPALIEQLSIVETRKHAVADESNDGFEPGAVKPGDPGDAEERIIGAHGPASL